MDMGGDVAGFAELQKAFAERIALLNSRLPFIKTYIFAPSVFCEILSRWQFGIRQSSHEAGAGRYHDNILKQMRSRFTPWGKFIKPANLKW